MLKWLGKMLGELAEGPAADLFWRDHRDVIIDAWNAARANGADEEAALEAATKAAIEHAI
ncbi:MAG TPA: hypothetical protein VM283_08285 [Armatimonadota bacterium]|nr:hypothetical protein [Armatimonadota bacterium]